MPTRSADACVLPADHANPRIIARIAFSNIGRAVRRPVINNDYLYPPVGLETDGIQCERQPFFGVVGGYYYRHQGIARLYWAGGHTSSIMK